MIRWMTKQAKLNGGTDAGTHRLLLQTDSKKKLTALCGGFPCWQLRMDHYAWDNLNSRRLGSRKMMAEDHMALRRRIRASLGHCIACHQWCMPGRYEGTAGNIYYDYCRHHGHVGFTGTVTAISTGMATATVGPFRQSEGVPSIHTLALLLCICRAVIYTCSVVQLHCFTRRDLEKIILLALTTIESTERMLCS